MGVFFVTAAAGGSVSLEGTLLHDYPEGYLSVGVTSAPLSSGDEHRRVLLTRAEAIELLRALADATGCVIAPHGES